MAIPINGARDQVVFLGGDTSMNQGVFLEWGTYKWQNAQFSAHLRLIIFDNTLVVASKTAFNGRPSCSTCLPVVKPKWFKKQRTIRWHIPVGNIWGNTSSPPHGYGRHVLQILHQWNSSSCEAGAMFRFLKATDNVEHFKHFKIK